jgi:hypothetical protein
MVLQDFFTNWSPCVVYFQMTSYNYRTIIIRCHHYVLEPDNRIGSADDILQMNRRYSANEPEIKCK